MKKFSVLILLFLIISQTANSQQIKYPDPKDSSVISIPSFYKYNGKIFPPEYKPQSVFLPGFQKGYHISENDIIKIEMTIQSNFPQKTKINNNRKFWEKYWRQYFGYYNKNNEVIIFIHLDEFKRKPTDDILEIWKTEVSLVNEKAEKHTTNDFVINLSKGTIRYYFMYINDNN